MKKIISVGVLLLITSGCAVQKDWQATGGSKSDGVVKLQYQYGGFELPKVSEEQALELAKKRCSAWGYTDAEAFGGVISQCNSMSASGCVSYLVTKEYQCTN